MVLNFSVHEEIFVAGICSNRQSLVKMSVNNGKDFDRFLFYPEPEVQHAEFYLKMAAADTRE
jgi:hypothetical protein